MLTMLTMLTRFPMMPFARAHACTQSRNIRLIRFRKTHLLRKVEAKEEEGEAEEEKEKEKEKG